jgi:hypothetical protein
VVALGLALTGCGSSEIRGPKVTTRSTPRHVNASGAAPAPTRGHFIEQVEAICRVDAARMAPVKQGIRALHFSTGRRHLPLLVLEGVSIEREDDSKIRALPPPVGDAVTIEKLLAAYTEKESAETMAAHDLARDSLSGARAARGALRMVHAANVRAHTLARSLGIRCRYSETK